MGVLVYMYIYKKRQYKYKIIIKTIITVFVKAIQIDQIIGFTNTVYFLSPKGSFLQWTFAIYGHFVQLKSLWSSR